MYFIVTLKLGFHTCSIFGSVENMSKKARKSSHRPCLPLVEVAEPTDQSMPSSPIYFDLAPFAAYISADDFAVLNLHYRNYLLYEKVLRQNHLTVSISNMQYILSICEMVHSFLEPVYQRVYCLVHERYQANADHFTVIGLMTAILRQFDSICVQTCAIRGCYSAILTSQDSDQIVADHYISYTSQWNTIVQSWLALFQVTELMLSFSAKCVGCVGCVNGLQFQEL